MNTDSIQKSIELIDEHFRGEYHNASEYERLLTRAVKLNEEVGELCEAVLHENGEQREEKGKRIDLGSEVADVIICTLMLAQMKRIDVWKEVETKLGKIKAKRNI